MTTKSNSFLPTWIYIAFVAIMLVGCASKNIVRTPVEVYDFPVGSNIPQQARTQNTFKTSRVKPKTAPITTTKVTPTRIKSGNNTDSAIPVYSYPKAQILPNTPENRTLIAQDLGAAGKAVIIEKVAPPAPKKLAKKPIVTNSKAPNAVKNSSNVKFSWPAIGKVTRKHGQAGKTGIDISGKVGESVFAAADGLITYTGTALRGYGKLIVIKHSANFLSVYAHNSAILVKEGQKVKRGKKIAEVGSTETNSPKLLFQLRKGKNKLDPLKYLPPQ